MASADRPLSPHLQVYRPQITSVLSITHRLSGVALSAATLLFTYWVGAAAYGPDAFARAQSLMGSWFGLLVLFGFTFALFFHMANGVRHLMWDIGKGFELKTLRRTGWAVVIVALGATALTWAFACPLLGGS